MAGSAVDWDKIREQLRVLVDTILGAKSTHSYMPRSIQAAQLPMFLISAGAGAHQRPAGDFHRVDRIWRLTLIVAKDGEGAYGDAQKVLEKFPERVEDLLHSNMRLTALDDQVYYAQITDDTGEAMIEVPPRSGNWYLGAEWLIGITTNRVIAAGE